MTLTRCTLGAQIRLVLLLEWLTRFPLIAPFPHTSQNLPICYTSLPNRLYTPLIYAQNIRAENQTMVFYHQRTTFASIFCCIDIYIHTPKCPHLGILTFFAHFGVPKSVYPFGCPLLHCSHLGVLRSVALIFCVPRSIAPILMSLTPFHSIGCPSLRCTHFWCSSLRCTHFSVPHSVALILVSLAPLHSFGCPLPHCSHLGIHRSVAPILYISLNVDTSNHCVYSLFAKMLNHMINNEGENKYESNATAASV